MGRANDQAGQRMRALDAQSKAQNDAGNCAGFKASDTRLPCSRPPDCRITVRGGEDDRLYCRYHRQVFEEFVGGIKVEML